MKDILNEPSIVTAIADRAARHIARVVIAKLQRSQRDSDFAPSDLKSEWDEICVQIRHDRWPDWKMQDFGIRVIVRGYVAALRSHEREAIWLRTDGGREWDLDDPEDCDRNPINDDQIVDYITDHYVYEMARWWSNPRIRAVVDATSWSNELDL